MLMTAARPVRSDQSSRTRYTPPAERSAISLTSVLDMAGRGQLTTKQLDLLRSDKTAIGEDVILHYAGQLDLLRRRCVSIVGTRDVTENGFARAKRLSRELAETGIVVVSGLARGIDFAAHTSAISSGGETVAVIGTPLSKAYPAENASLQEKIWTDHLLISPFAEGATVFKSNFPVRNRVMAALSDATVIVEASDTSGTLHQAAECQRLGRWLFIMRAVAEDRSLNWPKKFVGKPNVAILTATADILDAVGRP